MPASSASASNSRLHVLEGLALQRLPCRFESKAHREIPSRGFLRLWAIYFRCRISENIDSWHVADQRAALAMVLGQKMCLIFFKQRLIKAWEACNSVLEALHVLQPDYMLAWNILIFLFLEMYVDLHIFSRGLNALY